MENALLQSGLLLAASDNGHIDRREKREAKEFADNTELSRIAFYHSSKHMGIST
jgi:hypothetical protein